MQLSPRSGSLIQPRVERSGTLGKEKQYKGALKGQLNENKNINLPLQGAFAAARCRPKVSFRFTLG